MDPFVPSVPSGLPYRWVATGVRILVVLLGVATVWVFATRWNMWSGAAARQRTDDAYLESDVIPLSARVAGYVRTVNVGDFQRVRRGDVLAALVNDDYRAQVAQALASLQQSEAQIAILERQRDQQVATIAASTAGVASAVASARLYKLEVARQRNLFVQGHFASRQAVDQAEASDLQATAAHTQSVAQESAARKVLGTLDAQIAAARASQAAQRAVLELARINLGYTEIRAPVDGMVGQRQVRPGQYVGVGAQVISVVALPNVWVIANYKETQMTNIRRNQPAKVTVDAFPGRVFHGHVDSWSPASGARFSLLPPDNATGNFTKVIQRLAVKIVLDDVPAAGQVLLRPGMSVIATIDTDAGR
ncbi:HlyD family secretion protein [Luteibacter aegosomatissinici]|uniref:HlyD family secretion protein n=1 Tax=Luteibacter aegosomatissinici TaxID=2911539 RepID=UPI001FFA3F85|nr:HlyD family secretion protein [Luteibacter aegosomatissinici]UPG92721.1 HlyD family secretion protein [Luteibacter aegosomatissinici]